MTEPARHDQRADRGFDLAGRLRSLDETLWPLGRLSTADPVEEAREIVDQGWKFREFERLALQGDVDWAELGRVDRTWSFHLHSWVFLEPVLRSWNLGADARFLDWSVDVARSWLTWAEDAGSSSAAAWYDMATALRSTMLLELARSMARAGQPVSELEPIARAACNHARILTTPEMYNPRTNHGYYTAIAQVVVGRALDGFEDMVSVVNTGAERLNDIVERQFLSDGGHSEHSPEYHMLLLDSFKDAITSGHLTGVVDEGRLRAAVAALGWMVQPDGRLAQFGDTSAAIVVGTGRRYGDPETDYVLSRGGEGSPPRGNIAVFPQAGYAFARFPQLAPGVDLPEAGYLAFQAGFHSRAHKHSDDLTCIWFDRGHEILVDAGKYGYGELLDPKSPLRKQGFYYSSPERQYVESSAAHNTLTVDGVDHDRRRDPTGSGLLRCDASSLGVEFNARARHEDWMHERRLSWSPGGMLLIRDLVRSNEEKRCLRGWLNFSANLDVVSYDESWLKITASNWRTPLWVRCPERARFDIVVKGQKSPMLGWRSDADRSLSPAWCVSWTADFVERFMGTTALVFADSVQTADLLASRHARLYRSARLRDDDH